VGEADAPKSFAEWCARQPDVDGAIMAWIMGHRRDYRRAAPH
jgi:hypothetical protein